MVSKQTSKKFGRPRIHSEPKQKRQISLTDTAHNGVQTVANSLGMKSRSELIEAVGRQKALIYLPESSDINSKEIPIYPRLIAIMQPPVCRFRSTLTLARMLAYKLNIVKTLDDYFDNEAMVIDVVRKAFVILALEDYLYPNEYLMDVSSSAQWLVYKMLIGQAQIQDQSPDRDYFQGVFCPAKPDDDEEELKKKLRTEKLDLVIEQIFNALYLVKQNYALHYQIIYMRMAEGFTYTQVCKILRLLENDISEENVILYMRKGINALRQNWHEINRSGKTERKTDAKGDDGADRLFDCMKGFLEKAQFFYDLTKKDLIKKDKKGNIINDKIAEKDRLNFECLLLKAMFKPDLSLMLGEVLHIREHQFVDEINIDLEQYNEFQQSATKEIAATLEEELRLHLNGLKSKIRLCGTTQQCFKSSLMDTVNEIASNNITRVDIPEEYFYKKRKFLENYLPEACRV